jgi:predicted nucleic acid-binding protein
VIVYAESSAVLAWLLAQPRGDTAAEALAQAEVVIASELTLIECDRVLTRAASTGQLVEADAGSLQAILGEVSGRWAILGLSDEIALRARRPFPVEPVRTLDAIHLASALTARKAVADLEMLTLDERIREAATQLGISLVPSAL